MRGLPKLWASDYLINSGAKIGEPTKVRPDALSEQGEQPGNAGQQMGAEHLNELLHVLTEHVAQTRYAGLLDWRQAGSDTNAAETIGRNPVTGETFVSGSAGDLVAFTAESSVVVVPSSSNYTASALYIDADDGLGRIAFFRSGSNVLQVRTSNPEDRTFDTDSVAATGAQAPFSAAFDAVNNGIVGLARVVGFFRFTHAGGLELATSAPSVSAQFQVATGNPSQGVQVIACGAGRSMCVGGVSGNAFASYTSTDGGAHWSATATPPDGGQVFGVHYATDFLGMGPKFVVVAATGSLGSAAPVRIFYTDDGSSWGEVAGLPSWLTDASAEEGTSVLIGDTVIISRVGQPTIYVYDLKTGRGFGHAPSTNDVQGLWYDGVRLYASSGSGAVWVSAPITPPPSATLAPMQEA